MEQEISSLFRLMSASWVELGQGKVDKYLSHQERRDEELDSAVLEEFDNFSY